MAKLGYRVIDSDLHLMEPLDMYATRIEERWREKAPRLEVLPDGRRAQIMDGKIVPPWLADAKVTRANKPLVERAKGYWEKAQRRQFDPPTFLEAMDVEGIDIGIMFRTRASMYISDDDMDPAFAAALARGFNDWCAEFCKTDPQRFKGTGIVAQHDAQEAAREARRCIEDLGMIGIALLPTPVAGKHVHDPEFDVLWETLQGLNVPACFHGTSLGLSRDYVQARFVGHPSFRTIGHASAFTLELMLAAASMIVGGVLERFPRLRVAFLEGNCSWLPWWLYRLDDQWGKYGPGEEVRLSLKPSEYFLRQGYISVDADEELVRQVVEALGDDNLVFSTDFPHPDGPYPHAVDTFLAQEGISPQTKRKILWDNCTRLYDLTDLSLYSLS